MQAPAYKSALVTKCRATNSIYIYSTKRKILFYSRKENYFCQREALERNDHHDDDDVSFLAIERRKVLAINTGVYGATFFVFSNAMSNCEHVMEGPHQHACSPTNIWTKRSTNFP